MEQNPTLLKNLTQTIAISRSQIVQSPVQYTLLIKEDKSKKYEGVVKNKFNLKNLSSESLLLDFQGAMIRDILINGKSPQRAQDGSFSSLWNGYNIYLPAEHLKVGPNEVVIEFENNYANDGIGFHSFIDVDGKQYNYTNFEPDYCHLFFPCFDQPDIKGSLEVITVTPKEWVSISNEIQTSSQEFTPELLKSLFIEHKFPGIEKALLNLDSSFNIHRFQPTKVISTYLYALITGPFIEFKCEQPYHDIPMSIYCSESLAKYMKVQADNIFEFLNRGMEFYEAFFGYPHPFSKYDQIFCPEYNWGAMENAGAITFTDQYIFKGEVSLQRICGRGSTIVHELAHMWFGNLVTMKWWNDLWLNESFADFAAITCLKNCEYSFPTNNFDVQGHLWKSWGYVEDQNQTTHPIAGDVKDTSEAKSIFDGITYSKGSSVVLQLYYLLGKEAFTKALKNYFKKFEWSNTVLADFIEALDEQFPKNAGYSLNDWYKEWICTAGLNECEVHWISPTQIKVVQTAALKEFPTLRRHKMKIALFKKDGSIDSVEVLLKNEAETIIDIKNENYVAALPNHGDHTFIKVLLDKTSTEFFKQNLNLITEPGSRILIWRAFYDMVRDAKIASFEFVELVSRFIYSETEMTVLNHVLSFANNAIDGFTPPQYKKKYCHLLFEATLKHLLNGQPRSREDEVALITKLISFSKDDEDVHKLLQWYRGENDDLNKFKLNLDDDWSIVKKVHYSKKYSPQEKKQVFEVQFKKDNSDNARKIERECSAAIASSEEKEALWKTFTDPNQTESEKLMSAMMSGFNHDDAFPENDRFIDRFFESVIGVFEKTSVIYSESFFYNLYPAVYDFERLIQKNNELLQKTPEKLSVLIKSLRERNDILDRKRKCFAKFEEKFKN